MKGARALLELEREGLEEKLNHNISERETIRPLLTQSYPFWLSAHPWNKVMALFRVDSRIAYLNRKIIQHEKAKYDLSGSNYLLPIQLLGEMADRVSDDSLDSLGFQDVFQDPLYVSLTALIVGLTSLHQVQQLKQNKDCVV